MRQICAQQIVVLQHSVSFLRFGDWKKWALCSCWIIFWGDLCTNEREYPAGDVDEKHSSDKEPVAFLSYLITGEFLQSAQRHQIDSKSARQGHFGETCARMSRNSVYTSTSALLYRCILQPLPLTELYCCHEVPLNPKPVALHRKKNQGHADGREGMGWAWQPVARVRATASKRESEIILLSLKST